MVRMLHPIKYSGRLETLGTRSVEEGGVNYNYMIFADETGKESYVENILVLNRIDGSLKLGSDITLYCVGMPIPKKQGLNSNAMVHICYAASVASANAGEIIDCSEEVEKLILNANRSMKKVWRTMVYTFFFGITAGILTIPFLGLGLFIIAKTILHFRPMFKQKQNFTPVQVDLEKMRAAFA